MKGSAWVSSAKGLALPIVLRADETWHNDIFGPFPQIWSPTANAMIPISQVIERVIPESKTVRQKPNRQYCLTLHCDPSSGTATDLSNRLRPIIEGLDYPEGVSID